MCRSDFILRRMKRELLNLATQVFFFLIETDFAQHIRQIVPHCPAPVLGRVTDMHTACSAI